MKFTNKSNLPETFVRAIENQRKEYSGKNNEIFISVTSLIDDPHIRRLKNNHYEKIEVDVSDSIWMLFGTAFHKVMESGANENDLFEERLSSEFNEFVINGSFDYYDSKTKIIYDYKTTSVWSYIYGSRFSEWEKQLNIYAWLLRKCGFEVNGIANVLLFRDWSKTKSERNPDFPESSVIVKNHRLMDNPELGNYLIERTELHKQKDTTECSPESRWAESDVWAVHKSKKSGGYLKKAAKLFSSEKDAIEWAKNLEDYEIQFRPGKNKRCENYCDVCEFCEFYKNEVAK